MGFSYIYAQSDLDCIIDKGIVNNDVLIYGLEDISLKGIKEFKGELSMSGVDSVDLCNVEIIGGPFIVYTGYSCPLTINLSKLKYVGGDVCLSGTPLSSLGLLEHVGGNLNLKDTDIEDLSKLKYIGGNLYLPATLKEKVDLTNVEIKGCVKYFKSTKGKNYAYLRGLVKSEIKIPVVSPQYESDDPYFIPKVSPEEIEKRHAFYRYFKQNFEKGVVIDVKEILEYPEWLLNELVSDKTIPLTLLLEKYDRLIKAYPGLDFIAPHSFRFNSERYDLGWELCKRKQLLDISDIGYFEEKLGRPLFNVELLLRLEGAVELSPWGKQHLEDIIPFINAQFEAFEKKWGNRFLQVFVSPQYNPKGEYDFYKQFYVSESEFAFYNGLEYDKFLPTNYEKPPHHVVIHAIKGQCKQFTIDAEDNYRRSIGMPLVGEFWRSETELYYSIKEAFKDTEVKQHVSPKWLGRQHLDVYMPEYNIGIEYQGAQHYRPVEYFGGMESFIKGQERDERKRRLCAENDCKLIYVDEGYKLIDVLNQIKQQIHLIN